MNDASEFVYARDRLIKLLRNREVYTDQTTRFHIVAALGALAAKTGLLIGSLTARNDDLGQWRSYAANGQGCVLGIDARYLERDAGVHMSTVIYDEAGVHEMLCAAVDVVQQQYEDAPDDHETLSEFAQHLAADLFAIKHPCFADEREVRASRMLYRNEEGHLVDPGGKLTGGGKTPILPVQERETVFGAARFVSLPLDRPDGTSAIVGVGLGPTMPADMVSACRGMFEAHGLEVWRSTIPYRSA